MTVTVPDASTLEPRVKEIGRQIFAALADQRPHIYQTDWWQGQALEWAMRDEAFKVQLFRFVDVFPTLRHHQQVAEHLKEYFEHPSGELPRALRWGLKAAEPGHVTTRPAAAAIGHNIHAMAERFIAGHDAAAALPVLKRLRDQRMAFTLDVLGEASLSREEAEAYQRRYLELLRELPSQVAAWEPDPVLDDSPWGPLPRVNVSLKVTSLYSQIDPVDFEGSKAALLDRLRPLFRVARDNGAFLNLDLEQFRYRDLTYAVFTDLLLEDEFRAFPHAGIVVQAYLRDADTDVHHLIELAEQRGTPVTVRLVKGAYWDHETVAARQAHWPAPVFVHKVDSDAQFERMTRLLTEHSDVVRPALGTHNIRSMAQALATVRGAGLPDSTLEIQMLHGMAEPVKHAMVQMGLRVREYVPVGELVPGMAYLVRRLLENTANESFLRQTFVEGTRQEELLAAPLATPDLGGVTPTRTDVHPTDPVTPAVFVNEPHADFSREEARTDMYAALDEVRGQLGRHYPLVIGGREVDTRRVITSVNPARPAEVLGTVASASPTEADAAVAAAAAAFPAWRDASPARRAAVLFKAADLMRRERYRLSALMVLEAGKTWRDADADTAEAIDFLEYYGREARRLGEPRRLDDVPGERDVLFYEPRGVAAVISPWNFPVAILTGMASAALVAGNTAILKPANPTPLVAWEVFRLLREAGLPDGVLAFLPGPGAEVGSYLVNHPGVDVLAFTGSQAVGLQLIRDAAQTHPDQRNVKRVIAEMGGKNAIIIDADADLDAAVEGTTTSAFGYAGQKCSACSLAIVVGEIHDDFVGRLVKAARSLPMGDPAEPGTRLGPVITAEARDKIRSYIEIGIREATLAPVASGPLDESGATSEGYWVEPHVFVDVAPSATIAREEIFGPVLSVLRASDFDSALAIAGGTSYGLTGGVYSRSPLNIHKAYREFRVGNLYVNRGITGATVGRQPFGGSRMSGVGSKAGGPDYLLQFTEPRVVTENTLRRGFAPSEEIMGQI